MSNKQLTKQQASEFLEVNPKTIERAVKGGQLAATYIKTKFGQTPMFDQTELERFRDARTAPVYSPVTAVATSGKTSPTTKDQRTDKRQTDFSTFADQLADALNRRPQTVALTDKITLSVDDAANLSGLSKTFLKQAMEDGKLKTFPGQRGAKNVRRADLDAFIASL